MKLPEAAGVSIGMTKLQAEVCGVTTQKAGSRA